MKPRSVATLDESIHHFNVNLQRNPEIEVSYEAGLKKHVPKSGNDQIELYLITNFKGGPVHGDFTTRSFYGFDYPFPTTRRAMVIPDIRDFFARSLLKRPASANLGLNFYLGNSQLFTAGYSLDCNGKPVSGLGLPLTIILPPGGRDRSALEALCGLNDFNGIIDFAFKIYRDVSK